MCGPLMLIFGLISTWQTVYRADQPLLKIISFSLDKTKGEASNGSCQPAKNGNSKKDAVVQRKSFNDPMIDLTLTWMVQWQRRGWDIPVPFKGLGLSNRIRGHPSDAEVSSTLFT